MKIPTNLSLDEYRRVNESTMSRRGKRWTDLSTAEAQEILDEMNDEIVVLEAKIIVLEAQKRWSEQ
ncbi:UNVERIFIED_ORG: hypothetical protein FNL38_1011032 [Nocardia globerula]|uniref:Uncharacterized protein n=1 Tax=Nocardia globerula TaxID=1818 RepID=A0A652YYH6_NOCGL|nr:hypothetical protein [Rhodococcus globerulus]NMD58969.1 hypothetical protein [Nocardia globerula]PVX64966.1 hypothetical protein C8E04_2252 [Rhodococcus globerulus]